MLMMRKFCPWGCRRSCQACVVDVDGGRVLHVHRSSSHGAELAALAGLWQLSPYRTIDVGLELVAVVVARNCPAGPTEILEFAGVEGPVNEQGGAETTFSVCLYM